MSCCLNPFATFDIPGIVSCLPREADSDTSIDGAKSFLSSNSLDSARQSPVLTSRISISPSGEAAVVAKRNGVVILRSKWCYSDDENEPQEVFKVSATLTFDEDERVTAVACLPLLFRERERNHNRPLDWTCIVVGFTSGILKFYDEYGCWLLSKQLYKEPITNIKCQSFEPSNIHQREHQEEVYVLFESVIITISGPALCKALRKRRCDLALKAANVSNVDELQPLTYKVYEFTGQKDIADCEVLGNSSFARFDHLCRASKLGGYQADYLTAPPIYFEVVTCGKNDFVGFHYGFESVSGVGSLGEVAKLLLNSATELFSKKLSQTKDIATTDRLTHRFSIVDSVRQGKRIYRSPNQEYVAVTDNFGRISLIDSARGVVVRMFKGYQAAQCGWLTVDGIERASSHPRSSKSCYVNVLVIYSWRTGILELWMVPHGGLLGKLDVDKFGRLIYTSHRYFGSYDKKDQTQKWRQCVFLSRDGRLHDINVPSFCVLRDAGDRSFAQNRFYLRKLRKFLQESKDGDEQLAQETGVTASMFNTTKGKLECLKLLSTHKKSCPEAMKTAVSIFIDKIENENKGSKGLGSAEEKLLRICRQLDGLTSYYEYIQKQKDRPPDYSTVVEGSSTQTQSNSSQRGSDLSTLLFVSRREVSSLKMRLAMRQKRSTDARRVTFNDKSKKSLFVDYLSCFDVGKEVQKPGEGDEAQPSVGVRSEEDEKAGLRSELGEIILRDVLFSESDLSAFREELRDSRISPLDLTLLAIFYWLTIDLSDSANKEITRFAEILLVISHLEAESKIAADYNKISPWWQKVRDVLTGSTSPLNALAAAIACRSVAIRIECQIDDRYIKNAKLADESWSDTDESSDSEDLSEEKIKKKKSSTGDWEVMSADRSEWNRLIKRLEDVSLLDCILCRNPRSETNNIIGIPLPVLPFEKPTISLKTLLNEGTGSISKLVARWIASAGMVPKSLIDSTDVEWQTLKEHLQSKKKKKAQVSDIPASFFQDLEEEDVVLEGKEPFVSQCHRILKWHFPFSLTGSVLLMNLCLEYCSRWHSSIIKEDRPIAHDMFEAAFSCVTTIPSPHIKHGLCVVLWNGFIKDGVHLLIENFTKTPVRFTSSSRLYLDNASMEKISTQCLTFAKLLIEANELCMSLSPLGKESVFYQHEDLWDIGTDAANFHDWGPRNMTSVLSKVLERRNLDESQLSFILQFSIVAQMMTEVLHVSVGREFSYQKSSDDSIKGKELLKNLFPLRLSVIYTDLELTDQVRRSLTEKPNGILRRHRMNFLQRVIKDAVTARPLKFPSLDWVKHTGPEMKQALYWIARCEELASLWELDCDELRQYQVCLLYSLGLDPFAEEILATVKDQKSIANTLLLIAGKRLKLFLGEGYEDCVRLIEPSLFDWIRNLETDGIELVVEVKWIVDLVAKVVNISGSHRSQIMFEAVKSVEKSEELTSKLYPFQRPG